MKQLVIEYPESLLSGLKLSPEEFETEARMAIAVKFFEMKRLTSGQAAEIAGIPRAAFLLDRHRFGAPSVDWDKDELKAEFQRTIFSPEGDPR